ncbi:MAG: N-6 DNA methylase [Rubrivivax sp.]|nr:N-6 DNA methylase [Rubrivivax sp.]
MNKKALSESDICDKFIRPAMEQAGWDGMVQVYREFPLRAGRVVVRGRRAKRDASTVLRADYALFFKPNIPLAVVEAKDNHHAVGAGMAQAIHYAQLLDVPFSFASNGDGFVFRDATLTDGVLERNLTLAEFPSPAELWARYCAWKGWTPEVRQVTEHDYAPAKTPRYYQLNAINRTVEAVARGQKRALLVMATGTGKTYTAFQIIWRLWKSGQLLRQVINKLGAIDFNRQAERHQFNDLYEKILRDLQSAGNAGEFYTPRAVTQFMVDMVNPQLGEKVLDPATGTGGFLVCAIEHLRQQVNNTEQEALLQSSILGVEKKQLPHLLCVTNLLLHGIEVPSNVRHDNTLARPLRDVTPAERVDVVLTNPPFGGIEEPGIEAGFPADVRTKETADLFLVLIKHILKANGRAALVLPDGTLFGEGVNTRIKEQLLAECNLHTIVRLPNGVFAPYTGIKTNLLFFTKGRPTSTIWYYEHPYPTGVKNYNKTKPIRIEEFDAEKAWWGSEADGFAARVENERAWKVDIAAIKAAGYNLDQKNPHAPEAVSHDPDELLRDYARLQAEAQGLRNQLKAILAESLVGGR